MGNKKRDNERKAGVKVRTAIKGGRIAANHNRNLVVKTGVKSGKLSSNHNGRML